MFISDEGPEVNTVNVDIFWNRYIHITNIRRLIQDTFLYFGASLWKILNILFYWSAQIGTLCWLDCNKILTYLRYNIIQISVISIEMIKRAPHSSPLYLDISIPRFSEKYNLFYSSFWHDFSATPHPAGEVEKIVGLDIILLISSAWNSVLTWLISLCWHWHRKEGSNI